MWCNLICSIIYNCKQLKHDGKNIYFIKISKQSAALNWYLTLQPPQHHLMSLMFGRPSCLWRRIFRSPISAELHLTSPPLRTTYQFISCTNDKYVTPTSPPPLPPVSPPAHLSLQLVNHLCSFFFSLIPLCSIIFISCCFSHWLNSISSLSATFSLHPPSSPPQPIFSQPLSPLNHPHGSFQLQASAACNANMISSWNETCKCAAASPYPQWVPIGV